METQPDTQKTFPIQKYAREYAIHTQTTQFLGDLLAVAVGILLGFGLRFRSPLADFGVESVTPTFTDYLPLMILGIIFFQMLLYTSKIYEFKNLLRLKPTLHTILKVTIIWFFVFLGFSLIFKIEPPISRMFVAYSALSSLAILILWRTALNTLFVHHSVLASQLRQRAIVVGWDTGAQTLMDAIRHDPNHPYEILGCVPLPDGTFHQEPPGHVFRLGNYDEIIELIRFHKIDVIILADLNPGTPEIIRLANLCEKELIDFKIIPSYFDILLSGLQLDTISGVPLLGISKLPLDSVLNRILKRGVDIAGSIVGLILSAPLIGIFGALVYLESPGAIFYRQRRLGRYGIPFDIIKIRSMRLDAETGSGAQWCKVNDPRRLRIGEFIRKWNIDETPQFWNVLIGQMSLVGPRPERPELIADFKEEIPHYNARHNVKPGMTGWAAVHGLRGDTDLRERIRYDLYYLENWSLLQDFYIMLLTFFRRENSY